MHLVYRIGLDSFRDTFVTLKSHKKANKKYLLSTIFMSNIYIYTQSPIQKIHITTPIYFLWVINIFTQYKNTHKAHFPQLKHTKPTIIILGSNYIKPNKVQNMLAKPTNYSRPNKTPKVYPNMALKSSSITSGIFKIITGKGHHEHLGTHSRHRVEPSILRATFKL